MIMYMIRKLTFSSCEMEHFAKQGTGKDVLAALEFVAIRV